MSQLALTINGATEHLPETDDNRDIAMRRYWSAREAGDATARLVRVEELVAANGPTGPDDDPPPPSPAAPALPAPVAPGSVSPLALVRVRLQEEWAARAGFALAPPLFAPGTRVMPLGDTNFRTERRRVESLPPFAGAASAVIATIRQEDRRVRPARLHDLAMTGHGTLLVHGEEHALELGAFYQLAAHAGFGAGARYLAQLCDAELRADNVNRQLARAPNRHVHLRTRQWEGGSRRVFATVTPSYAPADTDSVLLAVAPALDDARAEMVYDGSGLSATALWMPDQVVDLAAGDIFKAGVRVEADDTGHGRVRVSAVVFRNRCLNLVVIGEGAVETTSRVHRGSAASILQAARHGVETAREKIGDFLAAWGHARTVRVDPEVVLRRWVDEKKLGPVGAREHDAVVQALLDAWQHEPGRTLADCVNAVSRAAHETPSWGMDFRAELERRAASLVLVPR